MLPNISGTKGTFGASASILSFSRPHCLQLRWEILRNKGQILMNLQMSIK